MLGPKEASMSETRQEMIEKAKSESGLDGETFDEIARSFDSEYLGIGYTKFTFKLKGHEVSGFLDSSPSGKGISQVQIDGGQVTGDKFRAFWGKYEKAVAALDSITTERTESELKEVNIDDLL